MVQFTGSRYSTNNMAALLVIHQNYCAGHRLDLGRVRFSEKDVFNRVVDVAFTEVSILYILSIL